MSSILSQVKTGVIPRAQRLIIYAPEGFGKSTIASQFNSPLFLDVEDSTSQMNVRRVGREVLPDLKTFKLALKEVSTTKPCKTLVLDTVDWLEQMATDAIIAEANSDKIQGIEDFGYGKGYTILREAFTYLLNDLEQVIRAGIHVVMLAHSKVVKFEPPDGAGAFDRYELKLSKQVAPLVKEWADLIIFGNWRTQIAEKGKGENTKYKGIGGRERLMHCNRCSAWDAKNRHGLADVEKWEIATIQRAFANVGVPWGEEQISEVKPAATATTGGGVPKSDAAPAPTQPVAKKAAAVPTAPKAQEKASPPKNSANGVAAQKTDSSEPVAARGSAKPEAATQPNLTGGEPYVAPQAPAADMPQPQVSVPGKSESAGSVAQSATAQETATASPSDGIPDLAPDNGGAEPAEPADPELEAAIGANGAKVTAYLLANKRIKDGQTFLSVDPAYRKRILANTAGFLGVVANWKGAAA